MLPKRAVVLWTGGKDCNLALYEAKQQGFDIIALISFAFVGSVFKAHSLKIMQQQAFALGIPHEMIPVQEPYAASYEEAILQIKNQYQVDTLITGDIAEIHGNSNWITERSKPSGVNVLLPLWHLDRQQLLDKLLELNFKIIFSCVKKPWFTSDWLGKELNKERIPELNKIHEQTGLDICGEQGEYHTLVLDGPMYKKEIVIDSYGEKKEDMIMYMEINKISMRKKQLA